MALITSREGEIIDVYILEDDPAILALLAANFYLLDAPRKIASCDRIRGSFLCPFAGEINLIPFCHAIDQQGEPEKRGITMGEISKRSPICQPSMNGSTQTITINPVRPLLK